jgi:hypothetical protein
MKALPNGVAGIVLSVAACLLVSGCLTDFSTLQSPLGQVVYNSQGDYATITTKDLSVDQCVKTGSGTGDASGQIEVTCYIGGVGGSLDFSGNVTFIEDYDDPLIVQVPAGSMIGGEAFRCDPFLGSELCTSIGNLSVTQGLASIPVDFKNQLVAEPGMQLAVIEFPPFPGKTAPPGTFHFRMQWSHPASTVKALFAIKAKVGDTTYYAPFLPCTTDMTSVPAVPLTDSISGAQILSLITSLTHCSHKAYDYGNDAGGGGGPPPAANYQGLWWVPNGTENFWGINFAHQGDQIFATWYTYDTSGNPWWLSMLANRAAGTTYSGDINANSGPPFSAYAGKGTPAKVGTGTLDFIDANNGTFSYSVTGGGGSAAQVKTITRYVLDAGSAQPSCVYSATTPDFAGARNYQDLWWASGGIEDGWGINFAHQGKLLFATWYTYATNGAPLWLSVLASQVGATNVYAGTLHRTSGPRYDAYDSAKALSQQVGTATLTFADGNNASFRYVTDGTGNLPAVDQMKAITRFLFAGTGGTTCQ